MIERNYSIDILKFICAILVVFLHTDCVYHDYILPLTRCAVPCFFMISGYLLFNDGDIEISRLKRSTRNILHIIVWSTLLFACYKEAVAIHQGSVYIPSLRELFNFIVLNENPFGGHLWYLGAYLYVLLIAMIISKYKIWKYMFLFVGLPYFALGACLKKYSDKISKIKYYYWLIGGILFSLTSLMEKWVLLYLDKNPGREHYFSSTLLALCLFLLVLSFKKKEPTIYSTIGNKDSLYIYIFHPLFISIIGMIVGKIASNSIVNIYSFTAPFVVFLSTMVFIIVIRKIRLIQ